MRLTIWTWAAILGLGLFCGSAYARSSLWLPMIDNPYCAITTYVYPDLPEQAMSTIDRDDQPAIVLSATTMSKSRPYANFLMAHECCHHSLGHVGRWRRELGHLGPQPFFYIAPALKGMELEADCCAVRMLKLKKRSDSIEAAQQTMAAFGTKATGAHYPTGIERSEYIAECIARAE